ncbi:ABC transporter permease subunit, partial [Salmonella enterica]|uniref:ABC transporter permease subunit n=1 Tax=Salmonella enterica TaxID=28901 RepID=UPI003CF4BD44
LKAVKTSEIVASCTGIDVARTKAVVFAIAAGFAGLSGALFGLFLRSFNATSFNISLSMELLMMVIVGSLTTIWGALFGALAIVVLP